MHALEHWRHLRLIRITAPAGYGKTTFAGSWLHSLGALPASERPLCAWLTLDNNPTVEHFVRLILEHLAACTPVLQRLLAVDSSSGSALHSVHMLCTILQEYQGPIVVVLDNVHLLTNSEALAALQQFIDEAPDHVHIMLLSRTQLDLRIADLVLHDAVTTFDERAMSFDHDEFNAFVRNAGFDSLDEDSLHFIEARSNGWVAGLKLLAHHFKYSGERWSGEADVHPGTSLMRFFEDKILNAFSAQEQQILQITALLPWATPALLAAVIERPEADCAHILQNIVRRFGFLMPYDAGDGDTDRVTYRLHPLLRDFLREAAALSPEARDDIRRRAASCLLEHDEIDAALTLLDATQIASVADLLASRMRAALLRYDINALQRWFRSVPASLLDQHAPLAVLAAWTAHFGISSEFDDAFERAAHVVERARAASLRIEISVLHGLQQMRGGATSVLMPLISEIESLLDDPISPSAGYLNAFHGWAMTDPQNPDAYIHSIQRAADIFERIGFHYGAIEMITSLAFIKRRTGNAAGAVHGLRTAEHILEHSRWSLGQIAIVVQYTLGEQLYLTNQVQQARIKLNNAAHINSYGDLLPEFGYLAALLTQLCELADGRTVSPNSEDFSAWNAALRCPLPQTIGMVAAVRILRDFRRGMPEACRHTAEQLGIQPNQLTDEHPDSIWPAVLSGAVLGGRTDAHLAPLLDRLETRCRSENFLSMALQVRVLRTLHAQAIGDDDNAFAFASPLFQDIERTGLLRLVLDYPNLSPLLGRCRTPFAQKLLTSMAGPDDSTAFELSQQEMRVLQMLLADHTAEEIARRLSLSMETIRSHMRRIYRKMNVHSRDEMMRVARAAGLNR